MERKQRDKRITWTSAIVASVSVACMTGIVIAGLLTGHDGRLLATGVIISGAVAFGALGIPIGLLLGRTYKEE